MRVVDKTKPFSSKFHAVRALVLTVVLFGFAAIPSRSVMADVVVLNNGDRITGEIVEEGPPKLTIQTAYAGEISIARSNVSRVEREADLAVKKPVANSTATDAAGKVPLEVTVDAKADMVEMEENNEWSGSVNLSVQLEDGSVNDEREVDGDFQLRWERGDQRFRMAGQVEYDTLNRVPTKQDWLLVPKYDHFFTEKAYWSLSYAAKQQKYEGLNLRQTMGPALGYEFFSNERTELISEIGAYYTTEDYTDGTHTSYGSPGWNLEYRRKIWEDRIEFYHRHFFFVRADDANKRILHTWTGFKFPIYEGVNLSTELELDYDNITLNRASTLEETIRLKLGYDW